MWFSRLSLATARQVSNCLFALGVLMALSPVYATLGVDAPALDSPVLSTGEACDAQNLQAYQSSYIDAKQSGQLEQQLTILKKLRTCLPQRGDLLVDAVQLQISLGNVQEVLTLRQELVDKNAPQGIVTLVDGWIASSAAGALHGVSSTAVDYGLPRSTKLGLGLGYDSNPNSGTDSREILLNIGGIPQRLQLTANNLPQSSFFQTVKLDAVFDSRLLGAQLSLYNKGIDGQSQLDNLFYIGQIFHGQRCGPAATCRQILLAGAGRTRNEDYEFINHRFSMDWKGSQMALSTSALRRNEQFDSLRLGGDWAFTPATVHLPIPETVVIEAGVSYDLAQTERAGGDQLRARIGADWSVTDALTLNAKSEWTNDLEEYSPGLFGPVERRINTLSVKGEYAFGKTKNGIYNLLVEKRISNSNIDLFSTNSLRMELNYLHSLGL